MFRLALGATFTGPGVNDTAVIDGHLTGQPFFATLTWFTYWVAQDPTWDWRGDPKSATSYTCHKSYTVGRAGTR